MQVFTYRIYLLMKLIFNALFRIFYQFFTWNQKSWDELILYPNIRSHHRVIEFKCLEIAIREIKSEIISSGQFFHRQYGRRELQRRFE